MKHKLVIPLGLLVMVWAVFATVPAGALQCVGFNGFYYAIPSWDQTLACTTRANCPRFVVLSNMKCEAVLDRETGLVWEESPGTRKDDWWDAQVHCNELTKGGRLGWRLPTVQELESLIDPTVMTSPSLPAGHPFIGVQSAYYWSATTVARDTGQAWIVPFMPFSDLINVGSSDKSNYGNIYNWCVRGGQGVDPQ